MQTNQPKTGKFRVLRKKRSNTIDLYAPHQAHNGDPVCCAATRSAQYVPGPLSRDATENAATATSLSAAVQRAIAEVALDDRFTQPSGRFYMNGSHALLRLMMLQRQIDERAGLNTGGFVTGYRGSPLGTIDQNAWKAKKRLEKSHIKFVPGVNEELAATAVWGTQQVNLHADAKYDGVFANGTEKAPGVEGRCGDVFKHANHAGSSKHGGVLLIAGDDHGAKSSTLPHQSDHEFISAVVPVLYPAGVQEYLDLGVHGFAMSRYSGCYVGIKAVTDTVESTASVVVDPNRIKPIISG